MPIGNLAPESAVARLRAPEVLIAAELRPPAARLSTADTMDTWIDMAHEVTQLARHDTILFLTDNAVGAAEEENLRHLATNLAGEVDPVKVVPFLTCKHTLDYCVLYAARAAARGYRAITVLGGDQRVGPPRCVPHAYQLRRVLQQRVPQLELGGWANPHGDAERMVDFLLDVEFGASFYLTQIVSHHAMRAVEAFVRAARRRGVTTPGVFGVFYYRSANRATLARLAEFLPVPAEAIARDFAAGRSAAEICGSTIRRLRDIGVTRVYVSNLGIRGAAERYRAVVAAVG
jgi:5,10-methylenetetrahydrofolate reductase